MALVTVLDPSSQQGSTTDDPGPDVRSLAGRKVGIRVDILWRSWDWVAEEWARLLEDDGAEVTTWRALGRTGDEGDKTLAELDGLIEGSEVMIVGLGNCGSCTSWTIHDAVIAAERGRSTVAVTTQHFEQLGRGIAAQKGRRGLRIHVLPYPLDTRPEAEVREIARHHYPALLQRLGVDV
jgi:hypothetical protein